MAQVDPRTCFMGPLLRITEALLYQVMRDVIEINSAYIENLNREQLAAGIDATGKPINPPYTKRTVFLKKEKGQPTDKVTLHDEGNYYDALFTEVFTDYFDLNNDDPKAAELREKYGDDIQGLTPENKFKLIDHLRPQFIVRLTQYLT